MPQEFTQFMQTTITNRNSTNLQTASNVTTIRLYPRVVNQRGRQQRTKTIQDIHKTLFLLQNQRNQQKMSDFLKWNEKLTKLFSEGRGTFDAPRKPEWIVYPHQ